MARKQRSKRRRQLRLAFAAFSVGAVMFAALMFTDGIRLGQSLVEIVTGGPAEVDCCEYPTILADHNMPLTAFLVRDLWEDGRPGRYTLPDRFATPAQAVYVGLLSNGELRSDIWSFKGTVLDGLKNGIARAKEKIPPGEREDVDTVVLFLGHSFQRVSKRNFDRDVLANRHRGRIAFEVRNKDKAVFFAPFKAVMENRSHYQLVNALAEANGVEHDKFLGESRIRVFDGEQIVVRLGYRPRATLLERGDRYVKVSDVSQKSVKAAARKATAWLKNNLSHEGQLNYGYLPAEGRPDRKNNMIRQWMATVAMNRAAKLAIDRGIWEKARQNIEYNLQHYYHRQGSFGLIHSDPDVIKLGAVALAGLAVLENYNGAQYKAEERALAQTVLSLWQPDGSFRTFFRPRSRNDNQNFYPGEALLFWASLYERDRDPELLERFMKSYEYYRSWHLQPDNRNPAFVPWHTQAYYKIWQITRDPRLRQAIFEMNDWLLDVQQRSVVDDYADFLGRFYDPNRPFGPPHSSSTGVYLEGLIDAFRLAREVGDRARAEQYQIAIVLGLRSTMQLQFDDDWDMFYVPKAKRKLVRGGVRTRAYDSTIRCDNVQHNLMAMLTILQTFSPQDYRIEPAGASPN